MTGSEDEVRAMRRALELAAAADLPLGPNPRVGCVLLDPGGRIVGEGAHHGSGTPHAEVVALAGAGPAARGATAVVTLEPCNHTGRTGPCSQALVAAGVARVVYAQSDPNPGASGGTATLRAAGIDVSAGMCVDDALALNREWSIAIARGRPYVRWKFAATLDGRSAAADGTSRWITSATARRDVHALRARCDAVLVGTGTAVADDPALTVRDADGRALPRDRQPTRIIVGRRTLPATLQIHDDAAPTVVLPTRDLDEMMADLQRREYRQVLLEGGPTLGAAMLTAGFVDEIVAYLAPALLGAGPPAVGDLGISTMAEIRRCELLESTVLGTGPEASVRITAAPQPLARPNPETKE